MLALSVMDGTLQGIFYLVAVVLLIAHSVIDPIGRAD
jgi:hypothetical protein